MPTQGRAARARFPEICRFGMSLLLLSALLAGLQVPDGPAVRVYRSHQTGIDRPVEASWVGWQQGAPLLAGQQTPELAADWFSLELRTSSAAGIPAASAQPPATPPWRLALAGGGVLIGEPSTLADGTPAFRLHGLPAEVSPMPFDTLWLSRLGQGRLPQADAEVDVLWARTPTGGRDVQRGYFLEWQAQGIDFEGPGGSKLFPWTRVEGIGLLAEELPQGAEELWIELRSGSTFAATITTMNADELQVKLPWGAAWSLPTSAVARLRRRAALQDLAATPWAVAEEPKTAAMDWKPKVGHAVEGGFLEVAGQRYAQGIGVHAPTTLQRSITSAGVLFLSVGVDDQVAHFHRPQPLRFEILLDQELLATVPRQEVGMAATSLVLALPHAGELRLRVVGADQLDFGGHGDWLDLQFLAIASE